MRATQSAVSIAIACACVLSQHEGNAFTSPHPHRSSVVSSRHRFVGTELRSTVDAESISPTGACSPSMQLVEQFLHQYRESLEEGNKWANEFGFADDNDGEETAEGSFYAIFRAIRNVDTINHSDGGGGEKLIGMSGTPFYIPGSLLAKAEDASGGDGGKNRFCDFFHFPHLATALEEDFLDAQVGSTDNRKGWQVAAVSQPTGTSFEEARMTLDQVKTAMEVSVVNSMGQSLSNYPLLPGCTWFSLVLLSLIILAPTFPASRAPPWQVPMHYPSLEL